MRAVDIATRTGASVWLETEGYRRGIELAVAHPDVDPDSIASMVTLPEADGRNEPDAIAPAAMLAEIQRAARRGWVDLPYESPAFQGLNKLVAWALSAGGVESDYTPFFEVGHGVDYERLDRAFERIGCDYEAVGGSASTPRVRPREAATTLGRVLVTLGVPIEEPSALTTLPAYLAECPEPLRRAFAYTYLHNRRSSAEPPAPERNSPAFRRALAAFLTRTLDAPATVTDGRVVLAGETEECRS
ncbi:hypothetical protein [Halalkalicoccus sp. NIPERK01]|uniref:hypothetical protein n=1 Tax=Halalkalicoccus sp. NIPERK01 TaxID=3053469 RepID=UPI00256F07B2|nr:hypothetical protein [Halalkalicoccus sp. NIPERK01]MDL5360628.1 hypothetical protein [Halalkalicoccus sp. NIPERK01]